MVTTRFSYYTEQDSKIKIFAILTWKVFIYLAIITEQTKYYFDFSHTFNLNSHLRLGELSHLRLLCVCVYV